MAIKMSAEAIPKKQASKEKKMAGLTQEERKRLEESMNRNDELMKRLAKM